MPATAIEAAYAPVTAEDILRVPVASDLVELAFSPRQQAVFVAAPDWEDETRSRVLRLAPDTLAVQAEIALNGKGFGVALDDAASRLYVTQGFNGAISVVDTASNRLIKQIPLMEKVHFASEFKRLNFSEIRSDFLLKALERFKITEDYPHKVREMVVDTKRHRLFAPGLGLGFDSVLFVIDTRTLTLEKVIEGFGYNAVGIALDEAGGRIFVANMAGQLMVVDADTLALKKTLEVQADQLLNLIYDPEHNRLFGVDQGIDRDDWRHNHLEREYRHRSEGHRLFTLDADAGTVISNLPTGEVPIGLRFDAARQRLYVTNRAGVRVATGNGSISVFDTAAYQPLQTIALPPHPNSLALDEAANVLYATVKNDGGTKQARQPEHVARIRLSAR
ncbi:hypothetical protein D8I35_03850 [Corticibacter populi]|uniref:YncE family protein n=2 Tax=Corticibacter populi TaxID=1550736 RepID=A0A3M6R0U2_9BURK|nr:hypothetical protein D8I35_03850 [Corticibacter populi]